MTGSYTLARTSSHDTSRAGVYEVDVFVKDDTAAYDAALPYMGDTLNLLALSPLTIGEVQPGGFGGGFYGSAVSTTFEDEGGALLSVLDAVADSKDLYLRIHGPNGRGGTITWTGLLVYSGEGYDVTAAPWIYPRQALTLAWKCGLSDGESVDAPAPTARPAFAARALATLADRPVRFLSGVRAEVGFDFGKSPTGDPSGLFIGQLDDAGDNVADRMERHAKALTLSVYQSLSLDPPEWIVVPRYLMGEAVAASSPGGAIRYSGPSGSGSYPYALPGETLTVDGDGPDGWSGEESDLLRGRRAPRLVRLVARGTSEARNPSDLPDSSVYLTADPTFQFVDSGTYPYWLASAGSPTATVGIATLQAGQARRADLGRFAATPGLRIGLTVVRVWNGPPDDPPSTPRGSVRLILTGDDSLTYYATDAGWSTTAGDLLTTSAANGREDGEGEYVTDPTSLYPIEDALTTEDLPVSGSLEVEIIGEGSVPGAYAGFSIVHAYPADDLGAPVNRFEASIQTSAPLGPEVEIPAMSSAAVNGSGGAVPALVFVSDAAGGTYDPRTAQAAERLAQSCRAGGLPLRVIQATVDGLVGPDTRLVFEGGGIDTFEAVFVGGSLDFDTVQTTGVWCEVTTDGLEST